jgi:hypothetical protein
LCLQEYIYSFVNMREHLKQTTNQSSPIV